MPFGDGTGPRGLGPMTGRAAGFCAGSGRPGFANPVPGRWFGGGYGAPMSAGFGGGYGAPMSPGFGWGYGAPMSAGFGWGFGRGFGRGRGRGRGWW